MKKFLIETNHRLTGVLSRCRYQVKKVTKFFQKFPHIGAHVGKFFVIGFFGLVFTIYVIPTFSFFVGDLFFGGIKPLYNVNLAQLLYTRSVNPLFGQSVPHYAHHQLSRTYFIQGDLERALREAQKELIIYPENKATYYILGLTYGYMRLEQEAIDAFTSYIAYNPRSWAARNDKAWLQFRVGDVEGAIETIASAVRRFPHVAWVHNTYCALLINKKLFSEAETACMNAKTSANRMTEEEWGRAYPGNDPRIYDTGLQSLHTSIDQNLALINQNKEKM